MHGLLKTPRRFRAAVVTVRLALVAGFIVLIQVLTEHGRIDPLVLPPPTKIADHLWSTLGTGQFRDDLVRTTIELGCAFSIGTATGLLIGASLASLPIVGSVFEPVLATFYAIPVVVFYPILLVYMGLNERPIILIAALTTMVPVALNTMVAFREVPPVLVKLARSLNCSRIQRYTKVMLPAGVPLVLPGVQLGFIAGLTMTVAMEFLLAGGGLGYRISSSYANYEALAVWSGIVVVVGLAVILVYLLKLVAVHIRQDMA